MFPALSGSAACAGQLPQYRTEELAFRSGAFTLVGDLRLPAGPGPHPAVVFVHGDGPNSRTGGVTYPPLMERMLRAGYATFAWDKPGTGASRGRLDGSRVIEQRAQIVADALEMLRARADVDQRRTGLWGISQAGYVIPLLLERGADIAFVICVGCPGEPGVEQGAFLVSAQARCAGGLSEADAREMERLIAAIEWATTYDEYARLKTALRGYPAFLALEAQGVNVDVAPRERWHEPNLEGGYFRDPVDAIARSAIPVLAVFGERDTQADPIQGSTAYRTALARAGNPDSRVELIPGTDHNVLRSATGCIAERDRRSRAGWSDYPAQYLDLIEEWLTTLTREGWSLPRP